MRIGRLEGIWTGLFLAAGISQAAVASAAMKPRPTLEWECAQCHDEAADGISAVTGAMVASSVHAGLGCRDCHIGISKIPHDEELPRVECGACHGDASAEYTHHGRGLVGTTLDLPDCADCHGSHEILPLSDARSRVNPRRLPDTCGQCHRDLDLAKRHDILLKQPVETYESSVHGLAVAQGKPAPTCTDCHSSTGTGHRILGMGDPRSSVNHFNIPNTCGRCHEEVRNEYGRGIHGQLLARGDTHTPVCTDCHGEHGILHPEDPRSNVSPTLVAQATCEPCHESARLNSVYGVPAGKLTSFVDSYHGLKSARGDATVANCASCHGAHKILPSSNPASSISPANLKATCGRCHPAITAEFAQTRIHDIDGTGAARWGNMVARIYVTLIVLVIGGMLGYVALDLRKHWKHHLARPQVERMNTNAIFQHALLAASFIILVITGFALRYSGAWLFRVMFGWDGGFEARGVIHRVAAAVFLFSVLWHVAYLRSPRGREFWAGMLPRRADLVELLQMARYFLDRRRHPPRLGRFSYVEKAEYWALVWGTVIMGATGVLLWWDGLALALFDKPVLDVFRVIHLYEAWLAALAIGVWHLYATVFKPGVFPGNPAWLTGKMPAEMYAEEHAGDLDRAENAEEVVSGEETHPATSATRAVPEVGSQGFR